MTYCVQQCRKNASDYEEDDWITMNEHDDLKGMAPPGHRWVLLQTFTEATVRGMMFSNGNNLTYVLRKSYHEIYKTFAYRVGDILWLPRSLDGTPLLDMLPFTPAGVLWHPLNHHLVILVRDARPPPESMMCCVCGNLSAGLACHGSFGGHPHYACASCATANGPTVKCPAYRCTAPFCHDNFVFGTVDTVLQFGCPCCSTTMRIDTAHVSILEQCLHVEQQSQNFGVALRPLPEYKDRYALLRYSARLVERFKDAPAFTHEKIATFFKVHVRALLLAMGLDCPSCAARVCPVCRTSHPGMLCYEISSSTCGR